MLSGLLSTIERDDLIQILKCIAYSMYQNPPLADDELRFLEQIVHLFNMNDYEKEKIFIIDIRNQLSFDVITKELHHSSAKGLLLMLEVTSCVFENKTLKTFIKDNVLPNLPFSTQIKQDLMKLSSEYVVTAGKIYNFIWGIEKKGIIWKTVTGDIDPYQKLFFADQDKLNQLSIEEKTSFLKILIYLMLDDGKIDESERDILATLSLLMGIKEDIIHCHDNRQELSVNVIESVHEDWFKRLLLFSFIFSRTGKINEYNFDRLNFLLGSFGISQDNFTIFLKDMDVFKENYCEIVKTIQSTKISGPINEKVAEYAQQGLSLIGAALSFIPGVAMAQKISQVGGTMMDRRSGGLMDFGLTDIQKDYQNKVLIICIDGFMSELSVEQFSDWKASLQQLDLNVWVKGFKWPSSSLASFFKIGGSAWYWAVCNTAKAGARLAHDIDMIYGFRPDIKIILMGHSLGSRVIFNTLTRLNVMGLKVHETYFLGGAVNRTDRAQWLVALNAVEHRAYNFYSANDDILKKLYQGTMMGDSPAGLGIIECHFSKDFNPAELINIDSTSLIGGHTEYKDKLAQLMTIEKHAFGLLQS